MGKIAGADYFEHQNHRGLKTIWAPESSWCVVQYQGRFGFDSISILEPKDSNFIQTDIGKRIDNALAAAINKKSHDGEEGGGGDATTYFRIGANRSVQVRAVSTTDPKEFDLKHAKYALFFGTFDLRSKKWLSAESRALQMGQYDVADVAFSDIESDLKGESFSTEADKAKSLDERMNAVYSTARLILPAARFAAVKQEQIKWLKQRDAATSTDEKCNLMVARIKMLQKLLW